MKKDMMLNFQMFADGGASATGADGGTGTTGTEGTTQTQAETKGASSQRKRGNKGDLSNVIYGKQELPANDDMEGSDAGSEADVTTTSNTLEDKRKAFEDLISGEYKEEFTKRTQDIINRRFRETKNIETKLNAAQPVIDMLMQKYHIDDGDMGKLTKAIDTDEKYWEEAAEKAGMTVEQYRTVQKLERENQQLREERRRSQGQQQMEEQLNDWYRQAGQVQEVYPSFDFEAECKNRDFLGLLRAGIPVQKAFETIHLDDLITGAARVSAKQAEQRTVNSIQSRSSRPAENGTSSQGGATIKSDVSKLTKADRAEIAQRVARGEIIKF